MLSFGLLPATLHNSKSEEGHSVRDPTRSLRIAIKSLCETLLPDAVGLSDAFGFTDWELDR